MVRDSVQLEFFYYIYMAVCIFKVHLKKSNSFKYRGPIIIFHYLPTFGICGRVWVRHTDLNVLYTGI